MDTYNLKTILDEVKNGSLYTVNRFEVKSDINNSVMNILNLSDWSKDIVDQVGIILEIANIIYYNSSQGTQLLSDGVYDLLLEKYKQYESNFKVGALPVQFIEDNSQDPLKKDLINPPFTIIDKAADMLYYENFIDYKHQYDFRRTSIPPWSIVIERNENIRNIPHNNLELVGTLDKCKFVLNKQAKEAGVYSDPKVKIFERDFLGRHVEEGLIDPDDNITLIAELKYDGISVEGEIVNGFLKNPRSRGDTGADKATDFSAFLGDYYFPRATHFKEPIGVKFEAIVMTPYLMEFQNRFGLTYVNARNAINGISGRLDASRFREYITLVPLKTDVKDEAEADGHLDRLVEINFLNEYIAREVNLKYAVIQGNYASVLWQVKRFVEEAEYMRSYMPFMYDGVVIEYYGANIRKTLGRENFIDKYSMAIKFTPLKVTTQFLGYDYTIGQNGIITPMAYYNPVEFYGTIHNHSSAHSYKRFMELGLKVGDIIQVEYMNDVMPYISKMDIKVNEDNPNPVIPFIDKCPFCGTPIEISESGKSAKCPNMSCSGRAIARTSNMVAKLDLRDFGEKSMILLQENLKVTSLAELFRLTVNDVAFLGPNNSIKFIDRINQLKTDPIYDYDIVGSLGFTNIAKSKWKIILNKIPLTAITYEHVLALEDVLYDIKGIGKSTIDTIIEERKIFFNDLETILSMTNVIPTLHMKMGVKIRFTGVRDKELVKKLSAKGHDVGEGTVTKDTDYLIVPYENFTSSKTQQAEKYGAKIITLAEAYDLFN